MKLLTLFFVGAALILCGCAMPSATVTGSAASGRLLRDTTHMVLMVDSARPPDCKERRIITVEPLVSDKPGVIMERWRVERCGQTKYYRITYTPTPSIGGTDFSVQEEK
ncbi:MAG: hypothetical protein KGR98_08275 [Verrucomicrobia bacterium]|nr:hypothetical protein [Verrucomicrobiota bacterium]MDE3099243.1 hypothetical protein [Verrucomicrobiota bacterium]